MATATEILHVTFAGVDGASRIADGSSVFGFGRSKRFSIDFEEHPGSVQCSVGEDD